MSSAAWSGLGIPFTSLVHAHLATQYGRYDEARLYLDACAGSTTRGSPESCLRARLRWALAAGKPDEGRAALAAIPPDRFDAEELWSLRAWFAARHGDEVAERIALEHVVAIEPGETRALDRLAELAMRAGQADRAAAIRRRQEEALRDQDRYRRLMIAGTDPIPVGELRERARLAGRLGRRFEAEGWLTLALERDPGDREAREALDRLSSDDLKLARRPGAPSLRRST